MSNDLSVVGVTALLLRRRRLMIAIPVIAAVLALVIALILPPTFTATAVFVPESSNSSRLPTGLAGLVGQLGLPLSLDAARSPRFYADVLKGRALLERVLLARYADPRGTGGGADSASLLDILGVRGADQGVRLARGVKELQARIGTQVNTQTNMVRLSVGLGYPELAATVAGRLLTYLDEFNSQTRQSQGRARRAFVEQRITTAGADLRAAEAQLRSFHERNRSWQESPTLTSQEGQLRRQVDIRQEVYLTLSRELETAKIEEVNDTPVITIIDPPVVPRERSKPKPLRLAVLGFVIGGVIALGWVFVTDYVDQLPSEDKIRLVGVRRSSR
ncbi:MAG TPA: GNVR domain-containing protein [Gemmatimonadales bacterium]|nr:GNVR domain-containing protein [Gemmatimonadales bacterium]